MSRASLVNRALLLALLIVVALVYLPGLGGGFIFDDYPNLVDNASLHVSRLAWSDWMAAMLSSPASSLQRPLTMLTFAVNHYFTALDPRPMKMTNIGIHMLNTVLVFGLVRAILSTVLRTSADDASRRAERGALFVSACWALHPINLMAVLFVVQRMESLSHTFVFAGLWLYTAGRRRQIAGAGGWVMVLAGLIPCVVLGLLAKESAVLLPLYAFCLELCVFRFQGKGEQRDRRLVALFVVVLALPALLGIAWLLPKALAPDAFASRSFTLAERLLTESRVVLSYLRWIVLPSLGQLSLYHDDYLPSHGLLNPPTTLFALIAIAGLLVVAWTCRRKRPLISLGLMWFLGAQVLTATIIPLELIFEHRNYFASLGICLALADLLVLAPEPGPARRIGALLAVAFLVFCTGTTFLRSVDWSDRVRFSISEAAKHPQSARATYDLARTMVILTNYKADSPFAKKAVAALKQAREAPHSGVLPDQASLMFAVRTGLPLQPEWWQDMNNKLSHQPLGPQELAAIGAMTKCAAEKYCQFPPADMMNLFGAALSRGPNAEVLNIYGDYALNVVGDTELALRLWQEAVTLQPRIGQYRIALSKLLIVLGRYDEARTQIAALRAIGRLGQNEAAAQGLERRLRAAMELKDSSSGTPKG